MCESLTWVDEIVFGHRYIPNKETKFHDKSIDIVNLIQIFDTFMAQLPRMFLTANLLGEFIHVYMPQYTKSSLVQMLLFAFYTLNNYPKRLMQILNASLGTHFRDL